jgi:hypothetical protein
MSRHLLKSEIGVSVAPFYGAAADIYLENTEWATSSGNPTFDFASTNDPHTGSVSVETTSVMGADNYLSFDNTAEISPGANELRMWWKCKLNMTVAGGKVWLQWYKDDVAVGSRLALFGGPGATYGVVGSNTSTYQEAVVPMTDFNLGSDVDELRIETDGGPSGTAVDFFLDDVTILSVSPEAPLRQKAGIVLNAGFTGNPKKSATITFATPFPDTNYSITLNPHTQNNSTYMCDHESKTATGFVINSHANNINDLIDVSWFASELGEN